MCACANHIGTLEAWLHWERLPGCWELALRCPKQGRKPKSDLALGRLLHTDSGVSLSLSSFICQMRSQRGAERPGAPAPHSSRSCSSNPQAAGRGAWPVGESGVLVLHLPLTYHAAWSPESVQRKPTMGEGEGGCDTGRSPRSDLRRWAPSPKVVPASVIAQRVAVEAEGRGLGICTLNGRHSSLLIPTASDPGVVAGGCLQSGNLHPENILLLGAGAGSSLGTGSLVRGQHFHRGANLSWPLLGGGMEGSISQSTGAAGRVGHRAGCREALQTPSLWPHSWSWGSHSPEATTGG